MKKKDAAKQQHLTAPGWQDGTVADFLGLTPEESALIEIKLALSKSLKQHRQKQMTRVHTQSLRPSSSLRFLRRVRHA